jgi:histidine ammonia-lyase
MNGTAVMTALACLAYDRADYLASWHPHHGDGLVRAGRQRAPLRRECCSRSSRMPACRQVAAWLRQDLHDRQWERNGKRLQDRYSIRCAPHVIGVLADALPFFRSVDRNELNSANDNPIIDAEGERVLHGGHFYGGHIAFAMDGMKNAVANLADLLDRQMALLVDSRYNHGLPANLSAPPARAPPSITA